MHICFWLEDKVDFSRWVNAPLYPFKVPFFSPAFPRCNNYHEFDVYSFSMFLCFLLQIDASTNQHRELLSFIHMVIEYMYYYSFLFFSSPLNIIFWEIPMMNHIDAPGNSVVYFTVIYLLYLYSTVFIFFIRHIEFSPQMFTTVNVFQWAFLYKSPGTYRWASL